MVLGESKRHEEKFDLFMLKFDEEVKRRKRDKAEMTAD